MTDEPIPASKARLFDVRRIIGGLFVVYGLLVGAIGVFDSQEQIDKAQGVNINLWAGLAMLVLGALFLLWQWLRPAEVPSGGESAE
jgi:ABC-type branched-subunit amino acid transport system permease subunit